jgi:voltage-gated potassium channel
VKTIGVFILARRAQSAFLGAVLLAILSGLFASIAILQVERAANGNIVSGADALWWSIVTMATVGYGDHFPITSEGRFLAAGLMIVGIGLFGTFTAWLATWCLAPTEKDQEAELESIREELVLMRRLLEQRL